MKRKRTTPKAGVIFAVPLCDGTYGLGHVVVYEYDAMCALFGTRSATPEDLLHGLDEVLSRPVAIVTLTGGELRSGEWPVIAFREPAYPPAWIPKFEGEGAVSYTATAGVGLLNAYHGLIPWDYMLATPDFYKSMLLPGVPVPPTVRYKRDFALSEQPAAVHGAPSEPTPQVTEGPAEIHIQILYPGNGLPTVEQLHKRQELERRVEEEGAGEVTDAGGGEGVLDIYLETGDVERAMPIVERLVAELGLAEDTLIEAGPLEDEDEDDEEDDE